MLLFLLRDTNLIISLPQGLLQTQLMNIIPCMEVYTVSSLDLLLTVKNISCTCPYYPGSHMTLLFFSNSFYCFGFKLITELYFLINDVFFTHHIADDSVISSPSPTGFKPCQIKMETLQKSMIYNAKNTWMKILIVQMKRYSKCQLF